MYVCIPRMYRLCNVPGSIYYRYAAAVAMHVCLHACLCMCMRVFA